MKLRALLAGCAAFLMLTGCAASGAEETERTFFAMDTVMQVRVFGDGGEEAVQAVCDEVQRLESLLSRTQPESDITRLNQSAGGGTWVALDGETAEVLDMALRYGEETGGAFDVTIAPVMDAWGFGTSEEEYRVPDGTELAALLPLVDSGLLTLDRENSSARLETAGMEVDLGGIAKGYAADRAKAVLEEAGITSALLNLGSSTVGLVGGKPDGSPWRIAVRDPADESASLGTLALTDCSVSTSGGYERYFEADGVIYHHILDPETGYPAEKGLLSVTVVTDDGSRADAWSTALYVMGAEEALSFWRQSGDFECILCRSDGTVQVTGGLEEAFTAEEDGNGYTFEIVRR